MFLLLLLKVPTCSQKKVTKMAAKRWLPRLAPGDTADVGYVQVAARGKRCGSRCPASRARLPRGSREEVRASTKLQSSENEELRSTRTPCSQKMKNRRLYEHHVRRRINSHSVILRNDS